VSRALIVEYRPLRADEEIKEGLRVKHAKSGRRAVVIGSSPWPAPHGSVAWHYTETDSKSGRKPANQWTDPREFRKRFQVLKSTRTIKEPT
jgi:hypothetical protein